MFEASEFPVKIFKAIFYRMNDSLKSDVPRQCQYRRNIFIDYSPRDVFGSFLLIKSPISHKTTMSGPR